MNSRTYEVPKDKQKEASTRSSKQAYSRINFDTNIHTHAFTPSEAHTRTFLIDFELIKQVTAISHVDGDH